MSYLFTFRVTTESLRKSLEGLYRKTSMTRYFNIDQYRKQKYGLILIYIIIIQYQHYESNWGCHIANFMSLAYKYLIYYYF